MQPLYFTAPANKPNKKQRLVQNIKILIKYIYIISMLDTAGEIRSYSLATFSERLQHMDMPGLTRQLGLTYISSVRTFDVIQRAYQER